MKQIIEKLGELLGMIFFLITPVILIASGTEIDDYIFTQVLTIVNLSLVLRQFHLLLFYGMIMVLSLVTFFYLKYPTNFQQENGYYYTYHLITRVLSGWIVMYWLLYSLINQQFFRGAVVTFPFLLGGCLLLLTVLGIRYDEQLAIFIKSLQKREQQQKSIGHYLKWLRPGRYVLLLILALIMILPNSLPLTGLYPSPPELPPVYGGELGSYDVQKIRLDHQIPANISEYLLPDNDNNSWYTFVYIPQVESSRELPVVFYAHGFTGTDPADYENTLYQLASRGSVVIFVQYVTDVELGGSFAESQSTNFTSSNAMYFRYLMEWSGIIQAVDNLQESDVLGSGILNTDYIQIIGHSVGGGMVPYLATQTINQGWGGGQLILDMETPWFAAEHPLINYNLSILPTTTIINIVGSEDDHLASPCIGMQYFEEFRENIADQNMAYIIIPSDFHGFPRLVATHYVVTSTLDDTLTRWGYLKRVDAMTDYLGLLANAETDDDVSIYFLGGTQTMISQGEWSDGTPVNQLIYSLDPFGIRGGENLSKLFVNSHDMGPEVCQIRN